MTVFVDTSAVVAMLDADDPRHGSAAGFWADATRERWRLVTTNYVIVETWAVLQRRFGLDAVCKFRAGIAPLLSTHWVDSELHETGAGLALIEPKRHLSLVDCVSFAFMLQARIKDVFAFDPHFGEQGFNVLPESGSGPDDKQGMEQ